MPKAEEHDLQKVTVNLYYGDFARLQDIASEMGGGGKLLRRLVRKFIQDVDARAKADKGKIKVEL